MSARIPLVALFAIALLVGHASAQTKADRKKAALGGKFKVLLRSIEVPADKATYGEFNDWGPWTGTEWAGYKDLPPGYWVYVEPNWFIWKQGGKSTPMIVRSVEEANKLNKTDLHVQVVMRKQDDAAILAAVLKNSPHLHTLDFHHLANGLPPKSLALLQRFRSMRELTFRGDANLDDDGFAQLGKLTDLESLHLKLP